MNFLKKNNLITLLISLALLSCNKDEADGVSTFSESYEVRISGSHPDRSIDSNIIVERDDVINVEKVKLNVGSANANSMTIVINLPANKTASGAKESIGIVITNTEETKLWNIDDTYQTFHVSLFANQPKKALMDYVIEGESGSYGTLFRFDRGDVIIKREGALLKGSFSGVLERDGRTGTVNINGSFEANIGEDNLE